MKSIRWNTTGCFHDRPAPGKNKALVQLQRIWLPCMRQFLPPPAPRLIAGAAAGLAGGSPQPPLLQSRGFWGLGGGRCGGGETINGRGLCRTAGRAAASTRCPASGSPVQVEAINALRSASMVSRICLRQDAKPPASRGGRAQISPSAACCAAVRRALRARSPHSLRCSGLAPSAVADGKAFAAAGGLVAAASSSRRCSSS